MKLDQAILINAAACRAWFWWTEHYGPITWADAVILRRLSVAQLETALDVLAAFRAQATRETGVRTVCPLVPRLELEQLLAAVQREAVRMDRLRRLMDGFDPNSDDS